MKNPPPVLLLPERACMLWGGFAAFLLAFVARLLASGDPAAAVFSGCVACLVGGWLGRVAGHYFNHNMMPAPIREDGDDEGDESGSQAASHP